LFLLFIVFEGYTQKIENVKATADGDFVHITYQLFGEFPEQTYNVKVYSSKDEYAKPLQFAEGDANKSNITQGSRKITFDAKKEFQSFEGEVKFRIVATVVSDFHVINPPMGLVTKRGKNIPVAWEGFRPGASVNIDLYVDGGFADQFGGPKGKKIKYAPFRVMLIEYSVECGAKQQVILETFLDDCMKGYEQIDDILLIRVKI